MTSELTMFTSEMESILAMLMLIPTTTGGPEEKGKLGVTKALLFFLFFLNAHILKRRSNIKLLDKFSSMHPQIFRFCVLTDAKIDKNHLHLKTAIFYRKCTVPLFNSSNTPIPKKTKKNHTEHKYKG